jgi:hypothetical protein
VMAEVVRRYIDGEIDAATAADQLQQRVSALQ